jgi:hypothetical protein
MFRGRSFARGGIEQLHLAGRLDELETRARKLPRRQIDLNDRLHRIEERIEEVITS